MRLGIDIDGVLTNFEGYWIEEAARYNYDKGRNSSYKPYYGLEVAYGYRSEDGKEIYPGEKEFIQDIFLGYAKECKVRQYAAEVTHLLHNKGHYIVIVTKRHTTYMGFGWSKEDAENEVISFLNDNDIYYDEIVFASAHGNKREECESLNLDILFDDCPYVVDELKGSTVKVIMMTSMFNFTVKDVIRVYSWYDFLNVIEKLSIGDS